MIEIYNHSNIITNIRNLIDDVIYVFVSNNNIDSKIKTQFIPLLDNLIQKLIIVGEHIHLNQYTTYDSNTIFSCQHILKKISNYVSEPMKFRINKCIDIINFKFEFDHLLQTFKYVCNVVKNELITQPIQQLNKYYYEQVGYIVRIIDTCCALHNILCPTIVELDMLNTRYNILENIICSDFSIQWLCILKNELTKLITEHNRLVKEYDYDTCDEELNDMDF